MDIFKIKEYILSNEKIPIILESLECKYIKQTSKYFQCSNPDGDNKTAITVYKNENISVVNYTRNIPTNNNKLDIFNLIEYFKDMNFFEALKWCCDTIGLDFYYNFDVDIPESLKLTKLILEMQRGINSDSEDDVVVVKPISSNILSYYNNYVNDLFYNDNISYCVQKEFEIGYDEFTNRITIPIRDSIGNLVGIKGRLFEKEIVSNESKYIYLEPTNKSKILYGLYKSLPHILEKKQCYVFESEKAVMQAYTLGIYNCVSIGGKKISQYQIEMLTRLCSDIIICFDQDVKYEEIEDISNRFIGEVNLYYIYDKNNILNEKESPIDNKEKWYKLINENLYKIS